MSGGDSVLIDHDGHVATLTLNRPERLNAVDGDLYTRLDAHLSEIASDRDVRAIVVGGSGRAFCSGADLKQHGGGETRDERRAYIALGQRVHRHLQTIPKPVVAAVHGAAVGAGLELALACDFIVVGLEARLRFPELALGTMIGGGATYTLVQRVGAARAKELVFFGRFFSGEKAAEIGLADKAVAGEEVVATAHQWARDLAARAPIPVGWAKRLFDSARTAEVDAALAAEAEALLACMESADWEEGRRAFREERTPRFSGE